LEARSAVRSNMFIAAVVSGATFSAPVRIRNMSSTGALVEGAAVPQEGSVVRLIRGALVVPAAVMWSSEGRCGLRFSSLVSVREWLAPPSNRQQQRVDDTVRVIKAGAIPLPLGPELHDATSSAELGIDLKMACSLLEQHCDDLLRDTQAAARYGERLQSLDIVLQTIAAVADVLAGDMDERSTASRLQNLRASASEALRRVG
jgi:hypothetical protein